MIKRKLVLFAMLLGLGSFFMLHACPSETHPGSIIHDVWLTGKVVDVKGRPVPDAVVYIRSSSGYSVTGYESEISKGEPTYNFTNGVNQVKDGSLVYARGGGEFTITVPVVAYSIFHLGRFRFAISAYIKNAVGKRREAKYQAINGDFDDTDEHNVVYWHPAPRDRYSSEAPYLTFVLPD